jgi:hypothetical protein
MLGHKPTVALGSESLVVDLFEFINVKGRK